MAHCLSPIRAAPANRSNLDTPSRARLAVETNPAIASSGLVPCDEDGLWRDEGGDPRGAGFLTAWPIALAGAIGIEGLGRVQFEAHGTWRRCRRWAGAQTAESPAAGKQRGLVMLGCGSRI